MKDKLSLPVLALRGLVVFPLTVVSLDVGRKESLAALEAAAHEKNTVILVSQRNPAVDAPDEEDLYNVGTIAEVKQMIKLPGGTVRLVAEGLSRARIDRYLSNEPFLQAIIYQTEEEDLSDDSEAVALQRTLYQEFKKFAQLSKQVSQDLLATVKESDSPGRMTDIIASHLPIDLTEKQDLLETFSVFERLERLYGILIKEIDILAIERKISSRVRKQMEKTQKEYYLREQMKAIQKELGQQDQRLEEIETYRTQLQELKAPAEVKERLTKEIDRLARIPPGVAEGVVVSNYIDWCLVLPWEATTTDAQDLNRAEEILDEDHYGLQEVKERILEYLAVRQLTETMKGPILCLVGPPGVGKTSLAQSVATALDRQFVRASLGGVRDEAEIRGHRRTYVGAMPGRVVQLLKQAKSKNPVFLLDEIDKMSMDFRGDPSSALLEVLDPEQNFAFVDHYIEMPLDLSRVLFLTTANAVHNIPRPLHDRMETIYIPGYTEDEKKEIAKRHLLSKQIRNHGLQEQQLQISDNVLVAIINEYTREAGVRNLERSLAGICRKAARRIAQGDDQVVRVTKQNLHKFLGLPKYRFNEALMDSEVGVATGLAWTEAGGDTLPVEVALMPGKGKLLLTGHLGEVMKESAKAALSYVQANAHGLDIEVDAFASTDIHIHVPQGAIPKDGPSAGITIATALISAFTKVAVDKSVGMTGEITLRGRVLPIGGLKEKVLAAHRARLTTVVLPKANEPEIKEISDKVRRKLTFHAVERIDEVLEIAFRERQHDEDK